MKTLVMSFALLFATGLMAQEKKMKVCIKIDENKNGEIQKIDTCFESTDHAEIEAFLQRMGVEHQIQMGEGNHSEMKTIVIKHDDEGEKMNKKHSKKHKKSGQEEIIVHVDENGNITTNNEDKNTKVIIKHVDGEAADLQQEIDSLIKIAEKEAGTDHVVKKEIRVYVSKKVSVNSLNEEDKKALPENLQKVSGKSFEGLEISPNPAIDKVTIHSKNNSSDVLKINVYNEKGQLVLEEEILNSDRELNKELNVSKLPKGIYFLHLEQGKKSEVKKLVISE